MRISHTLASVSLGESGLPHRTIVCSWSCSESELVALARAPPFFPRSWTAWLCVHTRGFRLVFGHSDSRSARGLYSALLSVLASLPIAVRLELGAARATSPRSVDGCRAFCFPISRAVWAGHQQTLKCVSMRGILSLACACAAACVVR